MDKGEKAIITQNLTELIGLTSCNKTFIRRFVEREMLSREEKEELEGEKTSTGKASLFYDYIVTKKDGFETLIEVCNDPAISHTAVAELLLAKQKAHLKEASKSRAAKVYPTSSSKAKKIKLQANETDSEKLPEPLYDIVHYGKPLNLEIEESGKRQYAFILNIIKFDGHSPRKGAWRDTDNLVKLLEHLKFKIFPEDKSLLYGQQWKKQVILEQFKIFKKRCIDDKVHSILVFFGSHGATDVLQTSDLKYLDVYGDIIYSLQVGTKQVGKKVPKIFINQSCQTDPPRDFKYTKIRPSVEDTYYVKAQIPKCKATRDIVCGTYFVNALVYVLMQNAYSMSLQNMMKEVQTLLTKMGELAVSLNSANDDQEEDDVQMSTSSDLGLKDEFYFFEDY